MASMVDSSRFSAGMVQDVDKHLQPKNTYRYAKNTRIKANRNSGDTEDGASYGIANMRGTILKSLLCEGYSIVKVIEAKNGAVCFSSNLQNSEIGYFIVEDNLPGSGKLRYYTLYNDRRDPNGDKLLFYKSLSIDGFSVYENEFIERIYFVDGYNENRTFNLNDFFRDKITFIRCSTDNLNPINGTNYSAI